MVKKALLIGINYEGTSAELKGCINDVENIKEILLSSFDYDCVKTLTEKSLSPTKSNIENSIKEFVRNTKSGDSLVFHYSGHGSHVSDKDGDESDKRDEVLVPLDYKKAGIITDDWLIDNLCKPLPKGVTLWCFADCCHSGTVLDLRYNIKSNCRPKYGSMPSRYISSQWSDDFSFSLEKSLNINADVFCLSGCQDQETAADAFINGQGQGAFTACLIEFLKRNEKVTLREALKEINCRLDMSRFKQNSQMSLSDLSNLNDIVKL